MRDFRQNKFLWQKQGCRRRNINGKLLSVKEEANVDVVVGMMLLLIISLAVLFGFKVTMWTVTAAGVEDALAASNLASAIIDLEEYGKSHVIWIADADRSFQMYREALCYNLDLDEHLNTSNSDFLARNVEIKQYIIYNVREDMVDIVVFNGTGERVSQTYGNRGEVFTPDNIMVETTTVYSRIGYWVESLAEQEIYAEKEKSIDIARWDSE